MEVMFERVAGIDIGKAINGQTDPRKIADLAIGKMRVKIPDLAQAVTGNFTEHHATMAKAILRRLDLVEQAIKECDEVIAAACAPWQHQIDLLQTIPGVGEKVAQVIVAETGADMSRFPSAGHLAALAGLAPAVNESAGRKVDRGEPARRQVALRDTGRGGRVGQPDARRKLPSRAASAARFRPGAKRAQVAVAHSILVAAYHILSRD